MNLAWALQRMLRRLLPLPPAERAVAAWQEAAALADEDVATNQAIGRHGLALLADLARRRPGPVRVLTHCNAGWLATVDWDKATIAAAMKDTLAAHQVKMGQLAPAVRVLVCGRPQTPSIDAVLALFSRSAVLARLQHV